MRNSSGIIALAIACTMCWCVGNAAAQTQSRNRLASEFGRAGTMRLATDPLTMNAIETSTLLLNEALALNPNNLELWQSALNLALLSENDQLKSRAVENINRIDTAHEPVRFMRLIEALDRHQTVESRVAACERLLVDENVQRIGHAAASRLALDVALLYQRQGDIDQFTHWLTKAVTWDASNRQAAAIAAGFFSTNVNDPVAEAELLVNLMLADPTDAGTQVELAQRLLERGAYAGAERLYRLAIKCLTLDEKEVVNSLIIDHALAQWGNGQPQEAISTIGRRHAQMDLQYMAFVQQQRPDLTLKQLKELVTPVDQDLATIDAIIRFVRGDEQAMERIERAIGAFQGSIDVAREMASLPDEERRGFVIDHAKTASDFLQIAWLALWTGVRTDQVPSWLAAAEDHQPLDSIARDRYAGWLALRQGDLDRALAALVPLAANDPAARLGVAQALLMQNRKADSAREYLAVAQSHPGSLMGLFAAAQVQKIVGQVVPPSEVAIALERLVASISQQFDRYVDDPSLAISLRVIPTKLTYDPYEPILLTIEMVNNTPYPLALDRNGPIRPQLMVLSTVRSAMTAGSGDLRPFILDIGRRLRLAPRERMTIQFDLRDQWPGAVINMFALNGAILRVRAQVNFGVSPIGRADPRLYGQEVEAPFIRVDGVRMDENWLRDTAAALPRMSGDELLEAMAMMSFRVAARPAQIPEGEERDILYGARITLAEIFAKLDPTSQAWLLAVMPKGVGLAVEGLGPVFAIAQKSEDRLVILSYLLFQTSGPRDPMFDAAKRNEDPVVRRLAEMMQGDALAAEANRQNLQN